MPPKNERLSLGGPSTVRYVTLIIAEGLMDVVGDIPFRMSTVTVKENGRYITSVVDAEKPSNKDISRIFAVLFDELNNGGKQDATEK